MARKKDLPTGLDGIDFSFDPTAAASKLPVDVMEGKKPLSDFMEIPCDMIHEFTQKKGSDFNHWPEDRFKELVESVRNTGVIEPVTVRTSTTKPGMYEMLAGEHRWKASIEADRRTIPAHVLRECSDSQASTVFSITNVLHRENTIRDKINGWWHYVESLRTGDTNVDELIDEGVISEDVRDEAKKGIRQIYRYAKMHDLIDELIDMAEQRRLSIKAGEQLAYLSAAQQTELLQYSQALNDPEKTRQLHRLAKGKIKDQEWGKEAIEAILFPNQVHPQNAYKIVTKSVSKIIKDNVAEEAYDEIVDVVADAIDKYLTKHPEKKLGGTTGRRKKKVEKKSS